MKFLNIIGSSFMLIFSIIFVVGYLLGALNLYFSDKNDYCVMTYMFEYPQYVRITVPENNIYPQYGLHAYSEGRFTERARKMWFDGVPVLFLPGNSGSHMQARSLASVALRKALSQGYEYHFDFFTISYNEELSGLYGGVLQSQTKFAAACISRILSLYRSNRYTKNVPTSVILIGHSMGGIIAKRLLAYPSTINTTNIAITLAAPLTAPVINFDHAMNDYYMLMDLEWDLYVNREPEIKDKKLLLSFGSGPRDILIPAGLTASNDSFINALTTAIPGVWVSPNHVGIVWCKQLVMTINKYLFDIVDPRSEQVSENKELLTRKARQYFQANRSMTLSPVIRRRNVTMLADAFWYEDNRRIYQISRPEIDKTTYLMIRLVSFPQNRFVAIESINVEDNDWIFGCNAMFTYNTYRYCKQGTSLTELSRWTGAATSFGKRKLATVHLHNILEQESEWTHVIVKVSPTRKPIVLNVDINDLASRQITVDLPSDFSFGKTIIKQETEQNSLYYELILPGFNKVYQAYLLYVEPTSSCKANQYHVSAEVHVPWAENHEYYHYFTHLKLSPMKLRLYKSNPNVTNGGEISEHVKVTLLLDPQCTFTISITSSWYHQLAQFARNFSSVLFPYVAAIVLLATRSNILSLREKGTCVSMHSALLNEGVKPYYALVFGRLGVMVLMSVPVLSFIFENASWKNPELEYFTRSLLVLPAYMIALGLLNIAVAAVLVVMVFWSQLAHRLLFRIMWRGGAGLAEKMASGLQKMPMMVSTTLVCGAPLSCGATSLVAGATFYAFLVSKMYEEYLEDYVYKLMAKVASRICRLFKSRNKVPTQNESDSALISQSSIKEQTNSENLKAIESKSDNDDKGDNDEVDNKLIQNDPKYEHKEENVTSVVKSDEKGPETDCDPNVKTGKDNDVDEELNNLNFHMMMFFLWLTVTLVNIPALQTWARNFKYSMVLKPDTSYHTGLVMSACSACVWQMNGPRKNLRYYDKVAALLFTMAVFILVLGPSSLTIVNYGVTFMFTIITLQQLFDKEEYIQDSELKQNDPTANEKSSEQAKSSESSNNSEETQKTNDESSGQDKSNSTSSKKPEETGDSNKTDEKKTEAESVNSNDDCVCNENRIYNVFKNLKEKLDFSED